MTDVAQSMRTHNVWCVHALYDFAWHWLVQARHNRRSPFKKAHMPQLMHAGFVWCHTTLADVYRPRIISPDRCAHATPEAASLCWCWCHYEMSFARCAHATSDACRLWLLTTRWCKNTTFVAFMPWRCYLTLEDVIFHIRICYARFEKTMTAIFFFWSMHKRSRLMFPNRCAHTTTNVFRACSI